MLKNTIPFCIPKDSGIRFALILLAGTLFSGCSTFSPLKESSVLKPKPYNVLWITAESLQADHLGCYGYPRDTSPHIDTFAQRGVLFENMINASCWTSESMVSDFTGMYSPVHGVNTRNKSVPNAWYMPMEMLRDAGYVIPKLQGYQADANYNNLGFTGAPLATAPDVWLKENADQRFFLWYHLLDTHLPYKPKSWDYVYWDDEKVPSPQSRERIAIVENNSVVVTGSVNFVQSEDQFGVTALYDGCIRRVDRIFKRILDTVEQEGLSKNTIIIFSADHGEELLEHGFVGHASTAKKANMFQEILATPLIIVFPEELPQGMRLPTQIRKVDIMPTLFDLLGLTPPPYLQGESLLPLIRDSDRAEPRTAFAATSMQGYKADQPDQVDDFKHALVKNHWKLIKTIRAGNTAQVQLFNLKVDPDERVDLHDTHPDQSHGMLKELERWEIKNKQWSKNWFTKNTYREPGYKTSWADRLKIRLGLKKKKLDLRGVASPPIITTPEQNTTLTAENTDGEIPIEWEGKKGIPYLLELQLGTGDYLFETLLRTDAPFIKRKFRASYWNEFISAYDPARLRVKIDHPDHNWSEWHTIRLK